MRWVLIWFALFIAVISVAFFAVNFVAFPLKFKKEIRAAAEVHSVDKALIAAVIRAESRFRQDAVSHRGAIGLMQIMPNTGTFIAVKMGKSEFDLFNPNDNISMGVWYLRYLLDRFKGDTKTALIAYNAGEGNVSRWLTAAGTDKLSTSPYKETNAYLEKVLNARNFYRLRI